MKIENYKIGNSLTKKTFFVKVLGCQYNEWDAARLSFVLKQNGLIETSAEEAEIILMLNCSVRKTGVDRALSFAKNFISQNKKVIVSGCLLEVDKKRFLNKGAYLWDGKDLKELKNILNCKLNILPDSDFRPQTNLIPITKGCNNFCSYCAVPYTRGREISRPVEDILDDAKKMIKDGQKEIWLLGQNVNSYNPSPAVISTHPVFNTNQTLSAVEREPTIGWIEGGEKSNRTLTKTSPFAQLLTLINNIHGDFKVYFTSNHPKDMTPDIIEAIATLPKITKAIHLPLQSGSNKILKAMNRPYTREQYLILVQKIIDRIPEVKLTTDTIVGFPGETEEDFQETVEIFKLIKFYQAYNNKYSPREGTAAFKLGDPVPWAEKQRRWKILNEMANKR
ncbi:MAG: radical SAM protein [Patescibacteria group bacterium]